MGYQVHAEAFSSLSLVIHWAPFCLCSVCMMWKALRRWEKASGSCSTQSRGKLLSLGSTSWVCCWPDQLAVCLAGVWHITTKGFGQTGDCTALIKPPQFESIYIFPPLSSLAVFLSWLSWNAKCWYGRPPAGRSCTTPDDHFIASFFSSRVTVHLILQNFLHETNISWMYALHLVIFFSFAFFLFNAVWKFTFINAMWRWCLRCV